MPINITLTDNSLRSFESPLTGAEFAASIGAGLAKAAVAMKVDGVQRDLSHTIAKDAKVSILTVKTEEGLEVMRHTMAAQVLARAIKELWPTAKLAIGPTIEDGFYYDIECETKISSDDFPKIEAKMLQIIKEDKPVQREMWDRSEAIKYFESIGATFKADIIKNAAEDDTTEKGKVSLYRQGGQDWHFMDLCRGPHVPRIGMISDAFKLTKISGSYWRGDSKGPQLQRIYGTMWPDKKQLQDYLTRIEEAEKRDHRKLGQEMDLFHMQEEAIGQVFWHDKGWTLYRTLENYVRNKIRNDGYIEVKTPILVDRTLWEKSGHWDKYSDLMFTSASDEDRTLAIKPMNCPCHVQIFRQGIKSYRDLPIRMAEFGACHRNEPSGALHGLMRVRGFTQDDAHIFCTEDQIIPETKKFCDLLKSVYTDLGFENIEIKVATRPEKRAGTDETWDKAEKALIDAVKAAGLVYDILEGEGAFYGPKLEFHLKDTIGRRWQCGTLQMDFVLPERLEAEYVGADGAKHRPVMLHRAILGSMERFIGILIEHHAGKFPFWLAPLQVVVATVTTTANEYAEKVAETLTEAGIRVATDLRNEKISYKVREHMVAKVPVILAVGEREATESTVSVRRLGSEKQEVLALSDALAKLRGECVL
jgi:threonyl-tRNA synthetase